jgi:hypothetical protein
LAETISIYFKKDRMIMVDTIKREGPKTELINMLRWEDDGGKIVEVNYSMPDRQFVQPVLTAAGMHDTFLQWNKHFVVEPFQAGTRIDLIRKKPSTNHPST